MKKLQIVLEMEIDEDAIKEIQIEEEDDIKTTDKYINNLVAVGKYRAVSYGGNVISISDAEVYLGQDALKMEE